MSSTTSKADKVGMLLVLQNRATLNLLSKILQPQPMNAFGLSILGASSAEEARDALRLFVPDIMVVDLDMDEGWPFLQQAVRRFPEINVIAATSSDQSAEVARRQGIENVLTASGNEDFIESLLSLLGVDDNTAPKGPGVLLVGRNDEELASHFALLMHSGYNVSIAEDAAAAIETLERNAEINVILMDLLVPGGGALDLIRDCRAKFPQTGVIALTGLPDNDLVREALSHGAFECLVKPLDADRMINAIEACLAHVEYRNQRPWWRRIWGNTA
jgi:CheY-like chemotaxis protein